MSSRFQCDVDQWNTMVPLKKFVKCLALVLLMLTGSLVVLLRTGLENRVLIPVETLSRARVFRYVRPRTLRVQTVVGSSQETLFNHLQWTKCTPSGDQTVLSNKTPSNWTRLANEEIYLHSAFLDLRGRFGGGHAFVRVLAYMRSRNPGIYDRLHCIYPALGMSVPAQSKEIWIPIWDRGIKESTFRSFMVNCLVPKALQSVKNVSLAFKVCEPIGTLPVRAVESELGSMIPKRNKFCLCVKPLLYPSEDMSRILVEWIEMNRLFGAEKIVFYLYYVEPKVRRVLDYYAHLGLVEVIPWSLPAELKDLKPNDLKIYFKRHLWQKRRTEVLPYNHCFYENRGQFQFILPIDIDEFVFPMLHDLWDEALADVFVRDPGIKTNSGSLSVQNAYFFRTWNPDANLDDKLVIESFTERSANLSRPGYSVKSFINTNVAVSLFNHYALSTLSPSQRLNTNLDPKIIRMNHYKDTCPDGFGNQCEENFLKFRTRDEAILYFLPKIQSQIAKAIDAVKL